MIKVTELSEAELRAISMEITDSFYDYKYNEGDTGFKKFFLSREDMFIYMSGIIKAAYKCGLLYTTSEKREGFLALTGEGVGSVSFVEGMKMILAEKRALGGFKKMKEFVKACFSNGHSIETRIKKEKRKYIKVEVLVVRKEYQKQGFMKKMLEDTYELGDKLGVPVILDTDDKDKSDRYVHLGMKLDRVRNCGEKFHIYDLIREPKEA